MVLGETTAIDHLNCGLCGVLCASRHLRHSCKELKGTERGFPPVVAGEVVREKWLLCRDEGEISDLYVMKFSDHIEIDAQKRFGKPILKGTRIAVGDVLNWLGNGMTTDEIIADFPELNEKQIQACLLYAASRENQLGIAS